MYIQPNTTSTRVGAALVLGGITAVGATFNAIYGASVGHGTLEKVSLASVSVLFDIAKVLSFAYAVHHFSRRAVLPFVFAALIWVATAGYAMYSAGSFVITQMTIGMSEQQRINREIADRKAQIDRLDADLDAAKLAKNVRGNLMWQSSGSCLTPTTLESQAYCTAYLLKLAKYTELKDASISDKRSVQPENAVLSLMSRWSGYSTEICMLGVALLLAMGIEIVASFAGVAFAKNRRDIIDDIEAEQRKRRHERHMAQIVAAKARNERRNEQRRLRRATAKAGGPALALVR